MHRRGRVPGHMKIRSHRAPMSAGVRAGLIVSLALFSAYSAVVFIALWSVENPGSALALFS